MEYTRDSLQPLLEQLAKPPDATVLSPGTMLGQRYVIVREVAHGGMGAVYEAHDTRLSQRRCALKVLRTAGLTTQEQAEAATWFAREAALLSGLRHPLIPTISDYFSDVWQTPRSAPPYP